MDPILLLLLHLLLLPSLSSSSTPPLDPSEISALKSMNIPTNPSPCSNPSLSNCSSTTPFRHLISLSLSNCSSSSTSSLSHLSHLSSLTSLHLLNCPLPHSLHLPPSILSFSSLHSPRPLTGVFLSKLHNLTSLTLSDSPISASGPSIILSGLPNLLSLSLSHTNLSGPFPKSWHQSSLTHLDLSSNLLHGPIHSSISDLLDLNNLSLSSNSLSGPIPDSLSSLSSLTYLDLSSNQLNGSIPTSLSEINSLRYLNLENNNFEGVMPFNGSFLKSLAVFKIGGNANLCYNSSTVSSNLKLGISKCDKNGLPVSPPAPKSDSSSSSSDDDTDSSDDLTSQKSSGHHGPNKVVLGIAIAFASIIFLIVFLIFIARRCV